MLEIDGIELITTSYLDDLETELTQRRAYDELIDEVNEGYVLLPIEFLRQVLVALDDHDYVEDDEGNCVACDVTGAILEILGEE